MLCRAAIIPSQGIEAVLELYVLRLRFASRYAQKSMFSAVKASRKVVCDCSHIAADRVAAMLFAISACEYFFVRCMCNA